METQPPSPILRVEVRISKLNRKRGALPVVANFVALEQPIILVKNQKRIGLEMAEIYRLNFDALRD